MRGEGGRFDARFCLTAGSGGRAQLSQGRSVSDRALIVVVVIERGDDVVSLGRAEVSWMRLRRHGRARRGGRISSMRQP